MKQRIIINIILVFLLVCTVGVYLHIKNSREQQKEVMAEMGTPTIPGFKSFFEVDEELLKKEGSRVNGNNIPAIDIASELHGSLAKLESIWKDHAAEDPLGIKQHKVYCLFHESRENDVDLKHLVFIVYIPNFGKISKEEQQTVRERCWMEAQLEASKIAGYPTLAVAIRGYENYDEIRIGRKEGIPLFSQNGGRYILYPYFADLSPGTKQAALSKPSRTTQP